MQLVNAEQYEKAKQSCEDDAYASAIFKWAEDWAELMEQKMSEGAKLEDIALQTSHETDKGYTGFMYGQAVRVLATFWQYGELLYQWYKSVRP